MTDLSRNRRWLWAARLIAGACLLACGPVTENPGLAGPCTEIGNPTGATGLSGKILDAEGRPVGGAVLLLLDLAPLFLD